MYEVHSPKCSCCDEGYTRLPLICRNFMQLLIIAKVVHISGDMLGLLCALSFVPLPARAHATDACLRALCAFASSWRWCLPPHGFSAMGVFSMPCHGLGARHRTMACLAICSAFLLVRFTRLMGRGAISDNPRHPQISQVCHEHRQVVETCKTVENVEIQSLQDGALSAHEAEGNAAPSCSRSVSGSP